MLAFAAIRRQLHCLAIGTMKGFVNVQHGLNGVLSGGHVLQAGSRIAPRAVADCDGIARLPSVDGYAENHLRPGRIVNLHPRLFARIIREQKQQTAVQWLGGA